jgi:hypothetical protein
MKRIKMVLLKLWFLFTIAFINTVDAQPPTYELYVTNQQLISTNTYQFDVFLLSTGTTPLELSSLQFGLGIDSSIANGGTLSFSFVAGSSQLNSLQAPVSFQMASVNQVQLINGIYYRFMNQAARSGPGAGSGTLISDIKTGCTSPGTRVGTYRLVNTVDFRNGSSLKHVFSVNAGSGRTNTIITAYVAGLNTTISGTNMGYQSTGTCDQNLILNPCSLTAQIDTFPIICYGGTDGSANITINGSGTISSGTYTLDGGPSLAFSTNPFTLSGLTSGSHSIVASVSNCSTPVTTFNINAPSGPINTQLTASACDNYILPWGTLVTSSGNYTNLYTSSNGCDSTVSYTVTIKNKTYRDTTAIACNSFTWYGNTYSASGVYTYLIAVPNSQQCDSILRLNLTVNPFPDTLQTTGASICGAGNATLSAALPAGVNCSWYDASTGGNLLSTSASYTTSISASSSFYAEAINTSTGCKSATRSVANVIITTGCNTVSNQTEISIYPNPTQNVFHIPSSLSNIVPVQVIIIDALGRRVKNFIIELNGDTVFGNDLLPGFYFIEITGTNINFRTKLLKF